MNIRRLAVQLTWTIVLLSRVAACDLDLHDMVTLVKLSRSYPSAFAVDLAGNTVDCAEVGPLRLIRPKGATFLYILDTGRSLERWYKTSWRPRFDIQGLVGGEYLEGNRFGQPELWIRYGRDQQLDGAKILESLASLRWVPLLVINASHFLSLEARQADPAKVAIVSWLIRDRVRISLLNAGYSETRLRLKFSPPKEFDVRSQVDAEFVWKGRPVTIVFEVPINLHSPVYVGRPTMLTRDRP